MPTTLRPISKKLYSTMNTRTGEIGRRECWAARTEDGIWEFERTEDTGTPWIVRHRPSGEVTYGYYGTLKSARTAVERGWVKTTPEYVRDHAAGEHPAYSLGGCPDCQAHWSKPLAVRRPTPVTA